MKVELAQSAYVLLLDNKSGRIECPEESSRSDMVESICYQKVVDAALAHRIDRLEKREGICCQKVVDTTLGKNPDDGLYLAYCS